MQKRQQPVTLIDEAADEPLARCKIDGGAEGLLARGRSGTGVEQLPLQPSPRRRQAGRHLGQKLRCLPPVTPGQSQPHAEEARLEGLGHVAYQATGLRRRAVDEQSGLGAVHPGGKRLG